MNFNHFLKIFKNCYYRSKIVQYGPKITQNMKIAKIVQNSVGQIIWYSKIYSNILDKYIHLPKYSLIFSRVNLFRYLFVIISICRIYSDIHWSQHLWKWIYSDIHSSQKMISVSHWFPFRLESSGQRLILLNGKT